MGQQDVVDVLQSGEWLDAHEIRQRIQEQTGATITVTSINTNLRRMRDHHTITWRDREEQINGRVMEVREYHL